MKRISISDQRPARIWTAIIVCVITFFVNSSVLTPDIMESRNIVTAREMVYDGNWMIPTMNGDLRFEKPPLPTWLTAVVEIISPDSIAMARAMAGLAALLLAFFFYKFAEKVLRIDPLVPTLILCTCYNVILMGRTASWDIYTHAFMMGGIYYISLALLNPGQQYGRFALAGVFVGLSIMSKGPVSLFALFVPFILAFCIFYRPSMKGKWGGVSVLVLMSLAIGCWWYIYVYLFHAEELAAVVDKESGSWLNRNVRPWYYYWKFFLESGVWSVLLLTSIFLPLIKKNFAKNWKISLFWMLFCLILLSCMPEKKTRYLLPMLIPASYLMGVLIVWWDGKFRSHKASRSDKVLFRLNDFLIAFAVAALPAAAWFELYQDGLISMTLWIVLLLVCIVIVAALVASAVILSPRGMLASVTLLFLLAEIIFLPVIKDIVNNTEMYSISHVNEVNEIKDIPFYYNGSEPLRIEMVYAAKRKIRPLDMDADSIRSRMPLVLLSHKGAASEVPADILMEADTVYIGRFDDNRRPKKSGRYKDDFIYHVTLIKPKK